MPFVHLHTHSEYSLLDGANRIPDLLGRIQTLGMDSLALTDHGNLHGAWQFYTEAKARGVRPILGFEAYLAFGSRHKREKPVDVPAGYSHLVLLAKNRVGYSNLIKLSSIGFLEGFYRRPRIDREALEQHRDGLIGLAACLSGEVALYLRQGNYESAKASARYFAQLFGRDGFWLEVQDHGLPEERVVAAGMYRLGQELGVPVVATNDAHYLRKDDAEAHDVLLAIGTGKDLDDPNRFRFFGQESYVKSEAEMQRLFQEHPEVVAETARVAELCEFDFEKRYFLPQFPRAPEFASDNDLLVHLARGGARARYGEPLPPAVEERLAYELGVISHTGYAGYFLIVSDITTAARARGISVGLGYALTLAEAAEKVPDLRAAAGQDERVRKILELGTRIEGLARHASVHAAGVVIAPGPLTDYVPVCLAPQEADAIITQFDMVGLEQVGMLKIDILGLKTLTVIHDAVEMVRARHGVTLDMEEIGRASCRERV